jgi:histone H3/H4
MVETNKFPKSVVKKIFKQRAKRFAALKNKDSVIRIAADTILSLEKLCTEYLEYVSDELLTLVYDGCKRNTVYTKDVEMMLKLKGNKTN